MKVDELETYLRPAQLIRERYVPFSAPTLWRKIKEGSFPKPLKVGGTSAWPMSVIKEWQRSQVTAQVAA